MNPGEQKLAVIGNPISHTASPQMHGAMIATLNLPIRYDAVLVANVPELQEFCDTVRQDPSFLGFNITIPHKEAVMPFIDELAPSAKRAQAVNTVVNHNGCLIGHNTDGEGYIYALEKECELKVKGLKVVVIGAGGAAKGIAISLLEHGVAALTITNRTLTKAQDLAKHLETFQFAPTVCPIDKSDAALQAADLVINTTPIGMADTASQTPVPVGAWCHSGQLISDIIYKPAQTEFLKQAKEKGAKTHGGAGMLAGQGALAFKLFTSHDAQFDIMRATL